MVLCVIIAEGAKGSLATVRNKLKTADDWIDFGLGEHVVWMIRTTLPPAYWRDELRPWIGTGGALTVIQCHRNWAGLTGTSAGWFHRNANYF